MASACRRQQPLAAIAGGERRARRLAPPPGAIAALSRLPPPPAAFRRPHPLRRRQHDVWLPSTWRCSLSPARHVWVRPPRRLSSPLPRWASSVLSPPMHQSLPQPLSLSRPLPLALSLLMRRRLSLPPRTLLSRPPLLPLPWLPQPQPRLRSPLWRLWLPPRRLSQLTRGGCCASHRNRRAATVAATRSHPLAHFILARVHSQLGVSGVTGGCGGGGGGVRVGRGKGMDGDAAARFLLADAATTTAPAVSSGQSPDEPVGGRSV